MMLISSLPLIRNRIIENITFFLKQFLYYTLITLSISFSMIYCAPDFSNPCDPTSEKYKNTLFTKLIIGDSSPLCFSNKLEKLENPTISPSAGTYYKTQNISISAKDISSNICYTMNGTDPSCNLSSCGNGSYYSQEFAISTTIEVKAISCKNGSNPSGISSSIYTLVPQYVYVPNELSDNVSMFKVDITSGTLSSLGTIAAGDGAFGIGATQNLGFVYVTNANSNDVSMFAIDKNTGLLNSLGTIVAGTLTRGLTVDPQNRFVYVANNTGSTVSQYLLNSSTGLLTGNGSIVSAGGLGGIVIDPQAEYVYSTQFSGNQVSQFIVNQVSGALNANGSTATGTGPRGVSIHPTGNFAYVANSSTNTVSMYSINRITGVLSANGYSYYS
jgi:DNA-binding beta-propeller fold protein YncE